MSRTRLGILIVCLLVLGSGSADAKPGKGRGRPMPQEVGCAVLLDPQVEPGIPFLSVVRRVPAYPGQWWSPAITWTMTVPTLPEYPEITSSLTKVYRGIVSSNRSEVELAVPDEEGIDFAGEVRVEVVVQERFQTAFCEATTVFAP